MHEKLRAKEEPHHWCSQFYEYLARAGAVSGELSDIYLAGFFEIDLAAFKVEEAELAKNLPEKEPIPQPRPAES
jgi:hypothetical protein